jgi:hypothetical protein
MLRPDAWRAESVQCFPVTTSSRNRRGKSRSWNVFMVDDQLVVDSSAERKKNSLKVKIEKIPLDKEESSADESFVFVN